MTEWHCNHYHKASLNKLHSVEFAAITGTTLIRAPPPFYLEKSELCPLKTEIYRSIQCTKDFKYIYIYTKCDFEFTQNLFFYPQ